MNFNALGPGAPAVLGRAELVIQGFILSDPNGNTTPRFGVVDAGCALLVNVTAEADVFVNVEAECEVLANVVAEADVFVNVEADCELRATVEAEAVLLAGSERCI